MNLSPGPSSDAASQNPIGSAGTRGQATKRLDFGARKCIGGTASLARKKKIKKAASRKLQATSSLTPEIGYCRIN